GNASMARDSVAPSLIRAQRPPQSVLWRGSLMRIDRSRTASPAERPLVVRSWSDSRKASRSDCLGIASGRTPAPGASEVAAGFARAGAPAGDDSVTEATVRPRAERSLR